MSTNAVGSTDRSTRAALIAGIALLVAATLAAYWPAIHGGFLFDDDSILTNSALVQASDGLRRMWLTTDAIDYWPLTHSSFWIEWRMWGDDPTGYHVTNVLLHAASALLIWAILRRLSIPGAWIASMIFALHPVNVQSVAWIAQRKNTLALVFFLVSVFCFSRDLKVPGSVMKVPGFVRERSVRDGSVREGQVARRNDPVIRSPGPSGPGWVWYVLSFLAFVLAMLSKGSAAILPGVLALLAWWIHGRVTRRDLARIAPFLLVAVGLTLVNIWFQQRMSGGERDVTIVERLLGAGGVIWFYLSKAIVPIRLMFMYPQWTISSGAAAWWIPVAAAIGVTVVLWWQRARPVFRALLFAWALFCIALVPVMGFSDVYFMTYSLVADHYQYIAVISVAACLGAAVQVLGFRVLGFWGSRAVACLMIGALGFLTWKQAHLYASGETLYRATLEANPDAWPLRNNLGAILLDRGADADALPHLRAALRDHPDYRDANNNICTALARVRLMDEAIAACRRALLADPDRAVSHYHLGVALAARGDLARARTAFETSLRLNPASAQARTYLAQLLHAMGNPAAAAAQFREVLRTRPDFATAQTGLGRALGELGDAPGAEAALRHAIRLQPAAAEPHRDLADLLLDLGRVDEAVTEYRTALARDPRSAEAHNNLGVALAKAGRNGEAVGAFQAAVALDPSFAPARDNLEKVSKRR